MQDQRETETLIRMFIKEKIDTDGVVKRSQFMKLICISIMRGVLINLYQYLNMLSNTMTSQEMSFS